MLDCEREFAMKTIDIVIPVLNEETALLLCVDTLTNYLSQSIDRPWTISIVDNGSSDETLLIAQGIASNDKRIRVLSLPSKGRGRALRTAWMQSRADIVCYMDVDLSTRLVALPPLLNAIDDGYDIAIGSRLMPKSIVTRSFKRGIISRVYNLLLRSIFGLKITDAQCGFKALSKEAANRLVPLIENNNWFFDSELLITGYVNNHTIAEIPVEWVEDSDTSVKIIKTVTEDLLGILRLKLTGIPRINYQQST